MPKHYEKHKKRIIYYILILSMIGFNWFTTYRVKNINSLFDLSMDRAQAMKIYIGDNAYGRTEDQDKINEVKKRLKPLRVRRMLKNEEAKVKDLGERYVVQLYGGFFRGNCNL